MKTTARARARSMKMTRRAWTAARDLSARGSGSDTDDIVSAAEVVGGSDAFAERWMTVKQYLHEPRWVLFSQVLRAETAHGGNERRRIAGQLEGEPIGAPFVRARQRPRGRRHRQRDASGSQRQQRQPGDVVDGR